MKKTYRRKWNFSILHNGEKGGMNLFAILTIVSIILVPIFHKWLHYQLLSCAIISFMLLGLTFIIIAIILGCTGLLLKH